MRQLAIWDSQNREEFFLLTSKDIGLPEALVEKDFWFVIH